MKLKPRHILWGGLALGLASMTIGAGSGCGAGIGTENHEGAADAVTAEGSYMPEGGNTPDSGMPGIGLQRPGLVPLLPLQEDDTRMEGNGFYCIRMRAAGSTHFGVYVDAIVSDTDGINEMGLAVFGERYMGRFLQSYPDGAAEAGYLQMKKNFGVNGEADLIALYAVDENGVETQFGFEEISCDELEDKLEEEPGKLF